MSSKFAEWRSLILYFKQRDYTPSQILGELKKIHGTDTPTLRTVQRWWTKFQQGCDTVTDKPRIGCPKSATFDGNLGLVLSLLEKNRRMTAEQVAKQINTSVSSAWRLMHLSLGIIAKNEAAVTTSEVNTSWEAPSCFLCGQVTLLTSLSQDRGHYLRQIQLFKTYLPQNGDEDGEETCATCLQEVTQVWDLNQQIETIRRDIATIVERAIRRRGDLGSLDSTRFGQLDTYKNTNTSSSSFSNCQSTDGSHRDLVSTAAPAATTNGTLPVKEEPASDCSGGEEDNIPEETFEKWLTKAEQRQTEQNILGQVVYPESEDPTSSTSSDLSTIRNISSRPKRKSRRLAEENLRQTTFSKELKNEQIFDDDDNEGDLKFIISDPEQDTDFESDLMQCPRKKKKSNTKTNSENEETALCPHCGKQYLGEKNLQVHIRAVHLNHRSYNCEFCDKIYVRSVDLTNHRNRVHNQGTFQCSLCSKKLSSKKEWAIHEATVCMVPGKDWSPQRLKKEFKVTLIKCSVKGCGKLVGSKNDMRSHLESHSGLRPNLCSTCGESFFRKSHLKRHSATVCGPGVNNPTS